MKNILIFLFATTTFFRLECALAQSVYKWEDEKGNVHYSNTPPEKGAKPVDLPKIMKAEVKIPKEALVSCDGHGGINCEAGADDDGSVICYDGFKEAASRFRFSCSGAKLEIANISDLKKDGSFTVYVRNKKNVAAQKVSVAFKASTGKDIKLKGPDVVESLGTGDYVYSPGGIADQNKGDIDLIDKPDAGQLSVNCSNCP